MEVQSTLDLVTLLPVQAFFDLQSFDFCDFGLNAVYNSNLFSSPLVLLSNLDLRRFRFLRFFLYVPTLTG